MPIFSVPCNNLTRHTVRHCAPSFLMALYLSASSPLPALLVSCSAILSLLLCPQT